MDLLVLRNQGICGYKSLNHAINMQGQNQCLNPLMSIYPSTTNRTQILLLNSLSNVDVAKLVADVTRSICCILVTHLLTKLEGQAPWPREWCHVPRYYSSFSWISYHATESIHIGTVPPWKNIEWVYFI